MDNELAPRMASNNTSSFPGLLGEVLLKFEAIEPRQRHIEHHVSVRESLELLIGTAGS